MILKKRQQRGWMEENLKKRNRRWLIDFVITLSVLVPLCILTEWWVPIVVGAYGFWNFYDGMTRRTNYD